MPGLYRALRRDPTQIRADGQWWRLAGQLLFACLATFAWAGGRAGNSAATFCLATSMTGLALIARRDRPALVGAAVTALDGVVLLALSDAHGEVVLAGLLLGLLIAAAAPRPREANRDGAAPPRPSRVDRDGRRSHSDIEKSARRHFFGSAGSSTAAR